MIEIGAKLTVEKTVTPELTAQVAGSGLLPDRKSTRLNSSHIV